MVDAPLKIERALATVEDEESDEIEECDDEKESEMSDRDERDFQGMSNTDSATSTGGSGDKRLRTEIDSNTRNPRQDEEHGYNDRQWDVRRARLTLSTTAFDCLEDVSDLSASDGSNHAAIACSAMTKIFSPAATTTILPLSGRLGSVMSPAVPSTRPLPASEMSTFGGAYPIYIGQPHDVDKSQFSLHSLEWLAPPQDESFDLFSDLVFSSLTDSIFHPLPAGIALQTRNPTRRRALRRQPHQLPAAAFDRSSDAPSSQQQQMGEAALVCSTNESTSVGMEGEFCGLTGPFFNGNSLG